MSKAVVALFYKVYGFMQRLMHTTILSNIKSMSASLVQSTYTALSFWKKMEKYGVTKTNMVMIGGVVAVTMAIKHIFFTDDRPAIENETVSNFSESLTRSIFDGDDTSTNGERASATTATEASYEERASTTNTTVTATATESSYGERADTTATEASYGEIVNELHMNTTASQMDGDTSIDESLVFLEEYFIAI